MMLQIDNLHVAIDGKEILRGFSLQVPAGEIHAIMGPNGAGKSTFAKVLGGHPAYEVTQGRIFFNGQNILELDPEERAALGLFMGFQYPVEIPGVTNAQFLLTACKALGKEEPDLEAKMKEMGIDPSFQHRNVNEGFSGGEKKRNEILQLSVLDPTFAILDETDSGLDIDALKIVAEGINNFMQPEKGLILITHYQRLLDHIRPDVVHVMVDGKIVETGGPELALKLEKEGYAEL